MGHEADRAHRATRSEVSCYLRRGDRGHALCDISLFPSRPMEGGGVDPTAEFAELQRHVVDHTQWPYEVIRPLVLLADRTTT